MKKCLILALAALLAISPFASAAQAGAPPAKERTAPEADFSRRSRRPPPPPRRPPPPRSNRRHKRDSGGGSIAGAIIGSVIAGLISNALNDDDDKVQRQYVQPAPPPRYVVPAPAQPVLVCDAYGNCWYE